MRRLLFSLIFISLSSCSPFGAKSLVEAIFSSNNISPFADGIIGTASMYDGASALYSSSVGASSVDWSTEARNCTNPSVSVHAINPDGSISETAIISAPIESGGVFKLSGLSAHGINLDSPLTNYVLKAAGCATEFYRPITAKNNQSVSLASSLIAYTAKIDDVAKTKMSLINKSDLLSLEMAISELPGANLTDLVNSVIASGPVSAQFQSIFNIPASRLKQLPPPYFLTTVPLTVFENSTTAYSFAMSHWNSEFVPAFEWILDGNIVSTTSNFSYTTLNNDQGTKTLVLRVGSSNAGSIDATKPVKQQSFSISVQNTYPAISPVLSLVGTPKRNFLSTQVQISTGTAMVNCDSFSRLALTESSLIQPVGIVTNFPITCTSAGLQSETFSISAGDATNKTVALWAMDAAGNVSATATSVNFTLDQTAPFASLVNLGAAVKGGSTQSVTYAASDVTAGVALIKLDFAEDGVSFSEIADLTLASSPYSWLVPVTNSAASRLRLRVIDDAGNSTTVVTPGFQIDSVNPVIAITLPALNARAQTGVTVSGNCEAPLPVVLSGSGVLAPQTVSCAAGTFSGAVTFTAGDGVKNITATQTDTAGNVGSDSRNFFKDNVVPTLTQTTMLQNPRYSNTNTITFGGACETGFSVIITGAESTTASCTAGAWTFATNKTSDATYTYNFTQTDEAGNSTSLTNYQWIRDTVSPVLTIASPSNGTAAQGGVTLTGVCETGLNLNFSGAGLLAGFSASCVAGTYSQIIFFSTGDGSKAIRVSQADLSGNVTNVDVTYVRDNAPPTLTQTLAMSPVLSNGSSITFGGACETGVLVSVYLASVFEATTSCSGSVWSYTTATQSTDASRSYSFQQTDAAGNQTQVSAVWVRDTVAPLITIATSSYMTSSNTVTFSGSCETGLSVAITGAEVSSVSCTSASWSFATNKTSDGIYNYTFAQTDAAGNLGSAIGTWTRDTNLPNLTITSGSQVLSVTNSTTISGVCAVGLNITIKLGGATENTIPCPAGNYTYTVNTQTTDASRTYELSQTNALLSTTTVTMIWIRDNTPPVLSAVSLNSGAANTSTPLVTVALQAADSLTKITHFCLKLINSAPNSSDSCWVDITGAPLSLTPALSLNLTSYLFSLEYTPQLYTVYAWTKDENANISVQAASASVDSDGITYAPGNPPSIGMFIASNTDAPSNPATNLQLTATAGQNIYVKWRATDVEGLAATPISLEFSSDDVIWNVLATNLANTSQGGCTADSVSSTLDNGGTGCYVVTSPTSGFIKFRIRVKDDTDKTALAQSMPMNITPVRIIAGNVERGLDGAASAALFLNRPADDVYYAFTGSFVVSSTGVIYTNDHTLGILKINPVDGVVSQVVPKTGSHSPDGALNSATLKNPIKLEIDSQDRLLIYDWDRIKRIDFTTNQISTLIGGGSNTADSVSDARNAQLMEYNTGTNYNEFLSNTSLQSFFVLPNGDLYFTDNFHWHRNRRYRYYKASDGSLNSFRITGVGQLPSTNAQNYSDCFSSNFSVEYNKVTSAIGFVRSLIYSPDWDNSCTSLHRTGMWTVSPGALDPVTFAPRTDITMTSSTGDPSHDWMTFPAIAKDGKIYSINRGWGRLMQYDSATNAWTRVLGSGALGYCADGTLATSCNISINDAFISSTGKIYFNDAGVIKTLNSTGQVVTLYGQSSQFGNGGHPTLARFANLRSLVRSDAGVITVLDAKNYVIRDINTTMTQINHLLGNGFFSNNSLTQSGLLSSVNTQPVSGAWNSLTLVNDKSTGDLFFKFWNHYSDGVAKINRSTASVEPLFAFGTSGDYVNSDGFLASQVADSLHRSGARFNLYGLNLVGFGNNSVLIARSKYPDNGGNWSDHSIKAYDLGSTVQSNVSTRTGDYMSNEFCNSGDSLSACTTPHYGGDSVGRPIFDSTTNRWLLHAGGLYYSSDKIQAANLTTGLMETLVTLPRAIINFTFRRFGGEEFVYYCADADARLYMYNVTTSTETQLSWPSSQMRCDGATGIDIDETNGKLYFIFKQNGLSGVGEYSL